ncbi:hypothetical protein [Nonomuraea turkmeniaca]|uniref:hypothetical protein n=1 Tax=Nonomuraea turkmeniaca TaxID=103838 RepID=UPI001B884659|nr:hypothetical protein [Nonomuraea turkmeniaca]
MDWQEWHDEYDRPDSRLSQRPRVVQSRIRPALDAAAPGRPVKAISLCAGQGRDLRAPRSEHWAIRDAVAMRHRLRLDR